MVKKTDISTLVRNCPCLYDSNDPEFGDKRKVDASWKAIASVLHVSVLEVQKQWLKCCELYYKYRSNTQNDIFVDNDTKALMAEMQFIEPYLLNSSFPYMGASSHGDQNNTLEKIGEPQKVASIRLIRLVQKHPLLYDTKDVYYRNKKKTEETWQSIAEQLGETVPQCTRRWSNLRKTFRRYIQTNTSIGKSKGQKSHPYSKELKFLIPILAESVIDNTCKNQRRQIKDGKPVETIEIGESSGADDDDDNDNVEDDENGDTKPNTDEAVSDNDNQEIDSTVNNNGKTEKRTTEQQASTNLKRLKRESLAESHLSDEVNDTEMRANENSNGDNNVMDEEETLNTENGKEHDEKNIKLECLRKSYLDTSDLENHPDMLFFRSVLPELERMTSQQKNKFRVAVLTSIDEILNS